VVKSLQPPPPPVRFGLERAAGSGNGLSMRWSGVPWQSYFVEHRPTLLSPTWETIGLRTSIPGDNTLHPLPPGPVQQGYYRLRMPR
jgi:hypothetical protein